MRRMRRCLAVALLVVTAAVVSAAPAGAPVNPDGTHWSSFRWGSFTYPARYFFVYDRSSDPAVSTATQQMVAALDNLWTYYPGLPYPIYLSDHANNGACGAFNIPNASFMTVCSGSFPGGQLGTASWGIGLNDHFVNPWIVVDSGLEAGTAFTAVCGMMGRAIGLDENPQADSCMKPVITGGEQLGFNSTDIVDLLGLYYSHYPN